VNLWTVFKREFALYFISPIFYLLGAAYLCFAGLFFALYLNTFNQGFAEPSMDGVLRTMAFLTMFFAPAITMRLMAEENRQGTIELLLTAPVRDWEVVVGKFLAAWAIVSLLIVVTLIYPFILTARGNPDQGVMMLSYLGLWLLSGAMLSVGVLASSLTQYQLVAFVLGLGGLLVLWLADVGQDLITAPIVGDVLSNLTIREHYYLRMLLGIIDWSDIAYFVGLTALCLFLAAQRLQMRRWSA
jgi:ABC-2 type transport system permease protein